MNPKISSTPRLNTAPTSLRPRFSTVSHIKPPFNMRTTRTGKIAHLPAEIREEVNRRLYDGQFQSVILAWLNSLPIVKEILAAHFHGVPISPQNLSEWKAGGHQDWLADQLSLSLAACHLLPVMSPPQALKVSKAI